MKTNHPITLLVFCCLGIFAGCRTTSQQRPTQEERELSTKLDSIIIPSVDFEDVTIGAAVESLVAQSVSLDPKHEGVVVSFPYPEERECPVSESRVHFQNVSLKQALQVIGKTSGLSGGISGREYVFQGCHMAPAQMITRGFPLRNSTMQHWLHEVIEESEPTPESLHRLFSHMGIHQTKGMTLTYDLAREVLTVSADEEDMVSIVHVVSLMNSLQVVPKVLTHPIATTSSTPVKIKGDDIFDHRSPIWAQHSSLIGVPNFHKINDFLYRSAQPTAIGMANLEAMGIKTVVSLRSFHSDRDELKGTGLAYEHLYVKAWHPEPKEVVSFLKIVTDTNRTPVLVHCQHGADRTGAMCALYRVAVQGWTKEEAIKEMTEGDFGFHEIWKNLPSWITDMDIEVIRKEVGITNVSIVVGPHGNSERNTDEFP